jgi:hypothetical protein
LLLEQLGAAPAATDPFSPPILSAPPGVYDTSFRLSLSPPPGSDAKILYTKNGRSPTPETAIEYNSPIFLDATESNLTTIRARAVLPDGRLSDEVIGTYAMNINADLPLVSLITDPENLWSAERGIFANRIMRGAKWERPAHITFLDENGRLLPIGFNGNPQLENGRVDITAATFDDPTFQAATVQAMQTVADPVYLAELEARLAEEWLTWQQALASETELVPPWPGLRQQQANIQRSLQPQQPIFATYVAAEDTPNGVLQLDINSVVNLPVEIVGIDFGADTNLPSQSDWVIDGTEYVLSDATHPLVLKSCAGEIAQVRLEIPLTEIYGANPNDTTLNANDMRIESRILGTDSLDYDQKVFDQRLSMVPNWKRPLPIEKELVIELKAPPKQTERLMIIMGEFPLLRSRNSKYIKGLLTGPR